VIFGVALGAYVIAVTHRTAFGIASVDALDRFGIGATALSMLAVVQIAFYALMQVPAGTLLDRWGPARVILAGSLIMAAGQALMAFAPSFGWALAARALVGAGDAPVFIAVTRLVAIHFPPRRVPVMVQLTGLIGQTGQLASAVPLAYLLHRSGWSPAFVSLAVLGVIAAGAVWWVLVRPTRDADADSQVRPRTGSVADALSTHWRTPGVRLGFWSHFLGPFSAHTIALVWGVPYFTTAQERSRADASLLLTCLVLANIAVAPFIGMLTAAHPLRRSWLVLGSAVVTALGWTALLLATTPRPLWQLIAFVVILGAGGPMSLVGMDFARSFAVKHKTGSAAGFVNMGGHLATMIGVLLVGVALEVISPRGSPYTLGEYRLAFASLAIPWVIGVVGVYRSRRDTRAGLAEEGILIPTLREVWRGRSARRRRTP
jgi:MFS family permease